ncbi:hypothetical protein ACSX1A_11595 [Pontibacter sp. MBLB2868]|uniref:hypothetical protein n=1 Tax=Pontibacter sp. MBLB2868 TaxID=3451555 RepID=UPI003F74B5A4
MKTEKNRVWKLLGTGLCFALFTGLVSCGGNDMETAEDTETIETTADTDAGVMDNWDNERFGTTFASNRNYGEWDENDDDLLDDNEFSNGFFETWDTNDDDLIDENEWTTANNDFGIEGQNWADWDVNKDNNLDENEFRTAFAKTTYYKDWDKDGDKMINEREYSDGIFSLWDDNNDGILDNNEYNDRYNRYYGTM